MQPAENLNGKMLCGRFAAPLLVAAPGVEIRPARVVVPLMLALPSPFKDRIPLKFSSFKQHIRLKSIQLPLVRFPYFEVTFE